ncbi:MAG: class I SAM-dependent RNA methyltransferase [Anaerolineales bacterium]|nr:class I SAM-dependent RNA methyltransferase [Anaerolineales bacterium]
MTSPTYDVTMETLVFGGDALGRLPDGRAVFVPHALPGETIRLRVVEEKPHHVRGEVMEVLQASQQRIAPRCPHFGECGGCHYQHLAYSNQLAAKTAIVRDQFRRIGGLENIPLQAIVASPQEWHYRNTVQFHLTPDGKLGYHRGGTQNVFPIQECFLPELALNDIWRQLDFEPIEDLHRIDLRVGADDELMLVLESNDIQAPEMTVEGLPLSVVHLSPAGAIVMAGSDFIDMEVNQKRFHVSAGSFFQVNIEGAQLMVEHVLENLSLTGEETLLDIYCGVGLFSAFLAPHVRRLIGIEVSPSACDDFMINLDAYDNVELYQDAAENVLPQLDVHPEIALVDPPRAGLAKGALQGLFRLAPKTLVYVSCDLATLARDARILCKEGYRLHSITPFDLFPQTCHIESVAFMSRIHQ